MLLASSVVEMDSGLEGLCFLVFFCLLLLDWLGLEFSPDETGDTWLIGRFLELGDWTMFTLG